MASSHVSTMGSKLPNKHTLYYFCLFVSTTNDNQLAIFSFVFLENLKLQINAWAVSLTLIWGHWRKAFRLTDTQTTGSN